MERERSASTEKVLKWPLMRGNKVARPPLRSCSATRAGATTGETPTGHSAHVTDSGLAQPGDGTHGWEGTRVQHANSEDPQDPGQMTPGEPAIYLSTKTVHSSGSAGGIPRDLAVAVVLGDMQVRGNGGHPGQIPPTPLPN